MLRVALLVLSAALMVITHAKLAALAFFGVVLWLFVRVVFGSTDDADGRRSL